MTNEKQEVVSKINLVDRLEFNTGLLKSGLIREDKLSDAMEYSMKVYDALPSCKYDANYVACMKAKLGLVLEKTLAKYGVQ